MGYDYPNLLLPVESLVAALASAKHGSFSGAASELNVTHAAVSRRVATAEHWAGIKIFDRHRWGVEVTAEGAQFLTRISLALDLIDGAAKPTRKFSQHTVRVSTTISFAQYWLVPRLALLEGNPADLRIEIKVDQRMINMPSPDIDVAIRCSQGESPTKDEDILFEETLYPVIAADLLKELRGEITPRRLATLPLLHCRESLKWRTWFQAMGLPFQIRPIDRVFENDNLVVMAVAQGLGIGLVDSRYDWDRGRELHWIDDKRMSIANPFKYHVLAGPGQNRAAPRLFMERLKNLAKETHQ